MKYIDFLKTKLDYGFSNGFKYSKKNKMLYEFQQLIVKWACEKGRAAIFADCGLGKTPMQLTWANNIEGKVIIFAPLSVNEQTIEEGKKFNIEVTRFNIQDDCKIKIANYENIEKINPDEFKGIVLDESSILKNVDGKTRRLLNDFSSKIEFRLACTATPAPNDISEIANHTEFLGIMKREEMLSKWFYNNGSDWNLKGHAIEKFYEWMTTWGCFISKPSDFGFKDEGFKLPELNIKPIYFNYEFKKEDELFSMNLKGIEDRVKIRKETVSVKSQKIADIVNNSNEQWIIWCGIDLESDTLHKLISESINLKGTDDIETKIDKIHLFKSGKIKCLITKPKIAGFGMNFQQANNMIFMGMSDSYEAYYQCIRREYRFGQKKDVNVYIGLAGNESQIYENVLRKEKEAKHIMNETIKKTNLHNPLLGSKHEKVEFKKQEFKTDLFTIFNDDSCEKLKEFEDNSIDFSVFSPPFVSLYTYSNSDRDLGNCKDTEEFFIHFNFIIKELYRIIKSGRNIAVHCMNLPTKKITDGFIGLKDFRGDIIRAFQNAGFIYHAEVCINKNPQVAAIRTHAKGLMFKQVHKDSSESRMGLADYVCCFKKQGDNKNPIIPDLTNDEWINYAQPVWLDIKETETLNSIKAEKDEKHMCPLQLEVIKRCIRLWSNKNEYVLSPFMGVGSEGVVSLQQERKFIGIELKKEYYEQSLKNLQKEYKSINEFKLF